jgi:hypothetical protein
VCEPDFFGRLAKTPCRYILRAALFKYAPTFLVTDFCQIYVLKILKGVIIMNNKTDKPEADFLHSMVIGYLCPLGYMSMGTINIELSD